MRDEWEVGPDTQRFMVTAAVRNCTDLPKDLEICLNGWESDESWVIDPDEPVHVKCEGWRL